MASSYQDVIDALRRAAEAIARRRLTGTETRLLESFFSGAKGTPRQRAREALRGFLSFTTEQFIREVKASDDADRAMDDLEKTLDDWTP